ncbi:hypothetical protein SAMN06269117_11336 [Balnearium lithotrophicum]|uniref:Uncharacterized protein n=1 Tax=Balnearium lithotrophicum TaxID=223788 RepID=A0A521CJJ6_9BACT|nr:hypothetical protein [Balnearium lithotrophicum]SMO59582.1 hypothetical protein SAMN06269117_11336 [Balnearium lithotrophicum]
MRGYFQRLKEYLRIFAAEIFSTLAEIPYLLSKIVALVTVFLLLPLLSLIDIENIEKTYLEGEEDET